MNDGGSGDRKSIASASTSTSSSFTPVQPMSGEKLQRRVTITNPHGFHLRPQGAFVQLAKQFESTITLARDAVRVNGKNPWDLMLLAAEQGTELLLEVDGADAPAALAALGDLLAAPSVDDEPPSPPLPKKG